MAITFHSKQEINTNGARSVTVDVPAGLTNDDRWISAIGHEGDDGPLTADPTAAGFLRSENKVETGSGGSFGSKTHLEGVYEKKITNAAGESSVTLTATQSTRWVVVSFIARGVDTTTFKDAASAPNTSSSATVTADSITTVTDGARSVMIAVGDELSTVTEDSGAGYTEYADFNNGNADTMHVQYKDIATAGATGTVDAVFSNSSADTASVHFVLRPASAGQSLTGTSVEPTVTIGTGTLDDWEIIAGTSVEPTVTIGTGNLDDWDELTGAAVEPTVTIGAGSLNPDDSLVGTAIEPVVTIGAGSLDDWDELAGTSVEPTVTIGAGELDLALTTQEIVGTAIEPTVTIGTGGLDPDDLLVGTAVEPTVTVGTGELNPDDALVGTAIEPTVTIGTGILLAEVVYGPQRIEAYDWNETTVVLSDRGTRVELDQANKLTATM